MENPKNLTLELLLAEFQNGIPDDLTDDQKVTILHQFPKYIAGGICSQSQNIKKKAKTERQILCYAAAVAHFIKYTDHACFTSPENLLSTFNALAPQFDLKPIKITTFYTVQTKAIESGLISRTTKHDNSTGQTWRHLKIDLNVLLTAIKSGFSKAFTAAKNLLNRFLKSSGQSQENSPKAAPILESQPTEKEENRSIIVNKESKDSKEQNKYKAVPAKDFYLQFFKEDAITVQELQYKARVAKDYDVNYKHFYFNRSDALELIRLHNKHGIKIGDGLMSFLRSTINRGYIAIKKRNEQALIEQERQEIIQACFTWAKANNVEEQTAYELLIRKLDSKGMKTSDIPAPKAPKAPKVMAAPKSKEQERLEWIKSMTSEFQRRRACEEHGIDYDQLMSEIVYC